jgi:translation initiation factor 2 gamma subunit (eIF-2gamma)
MIYQLGGIRTQRDSREKKRNITIKAGYANIKLWNCIECNKNYSSGENIYEYKCNICNNICKLDNYISFADCPGHQELIETMLSSISLMKGAIVVISVLEPLKNKPQLIQHLIAAKMNNLDKLIICLNKCDLVSKIMVEERKVELDILLKKLGIKPLIIIPTSFTHKIGITDLIKAINFFFGTTSDLDNSNNTLFRITRSFDINQPGINYKSIVGGCVGGSLISGNLQLDDIVEIRPGILTKGKDGRYTNEPIITKLLSFESDKKKIDQVEPGGLVALLTYIDPCFCKGDALRGNILTKLGEGLTVYQDIKLSYTNIDELGIWIPKNGDKIFLQIGNMSSEAKLMKIKNEILFLQLTKPVCIDDKSKILVCVKQPILKIVGIGMLII